MRALKWSIIVLSVALSLISVRGAASQTTATISFYFYGDQAEEAAYQSLVTAFQNKHPEIQVKPVYSAGEDEFKFGDQEDAYRTRLTLDFASQTPPDVFLIPYREYPVFGERGLLEPVAPYLSRSSLIKDADFFPQALTVFTEDNSLVCLPQNLSATVVYYNKILFDKAGVAYPKTGWTWDDFVKTAKALTNTSDPKHAQYGLVTNVDFNRLASFIWQNGGQIVDNDDHPTKLTLGSAEAKAAWQFFADLRQKAQVTPDETQAQAQSNEDRFISGSVGMLLFSRRITPTLRKASFDWDVAPLPQGKQAASLLYSDGYCLSKGSPAKDAAWTFIEYANSPEGQTLLAKTGRNVPSLKAVAESPAFLDSNAKPKNSQLFLDLIPALRALPHSVHWEDIQETINEQVEQTYYDGKAIDTAVKDADEAAAPYYK